MVDTLAVTAMAQPSERGRALTDDLVGFRIVNDDGMPCPLAVATASFDLASGQIREAEPLGLREELLEGGNVEPALRSGWHRRCPGPSG